MVIFMRDLITVVILMEKENICGKMVLVLKVSSTMDIEMVKEF